MPSENDGAALNRGWFTLLLTQQERYIKIERGRTIRKKIVELEMSNYTLRWHHAKVSFLSIPIRALVGLFFFQSSNKYDDLVFRILIL